MYNNDALLNLGMFAKLVPFKRKKKKKLTVQWKLH